MPVAPEPSASVERLLSARRELRGIRKTAAGSLAYYWRKDRFVSRPWRALEESDAGNPTSAAFVASLLLPSRSFDDGFGPSASGFLAYLASAVPNKLRDQASEQSEPSTYGTPILMVGALVAASAGAVKATIPDSSLKPHLEWLIGEIEAFGCLRSINTTDYVSDDKDPAGSPAGTGSARDQRPPSAFSTLWAYEALSLAKGRFTDLDEKIIACAILIEAWAERALYSLISWHSAGVVARFDPVEALCAASIIYRAPDISERGGLADHAVSITLRDYSSNGLLTRGKAVLTASEADGSTQTVYCSTYEALAYLLIGLRKTGRMPSEPDLLWEALMETARHIGATWQPSTGLPNDQDWRIGGAALSTAFSTASGLAFLGGLDWLLRERLDSEARKALGVPSAPPAGTRGLPIFLESIFKSSMLGKVNHSNGDREAGVYSMIWFGPPGTGKTSFAKSIAAQLGWPLLEITQKDFLAYGSDYIDASAEKIFRLLLCVKNVVILFDELEELLQAREAPHDKPETAHQNERSSRMLTTSMLPRIHELRDRSQSVFIFATNRLKSFDPAATRLGRFDAIIGLPPPNLEERENIWKSLKKKWLSSLSKEGQKHVDAELARQKFPAAFRGTTFKDLEFVAKQIHNADDMGSLDQGYVDSLLSSCQSIHEETLRDFEKLLKDDTRPRMEIQLT